MDNRGLFYYKPADRVAELYYEFWRENGRNARLFPLACRTGDHFLGCYVVPQALHAHLQPFQFAEGGQRVVHVGFHDQYIDTGISHPLILAALVGEGGAVYAIDPDETNTEAMRSYVEDNGVCNLFVVQSGVWEEKGTTEFVMFSDYTSSNTVAGVFESFKNGAEKRWGKKRIEEQSRTGTIQVDTLDNVVRSHIGSDFPVDLLNLTVNGAETRILRGARETLASNEAIKVCFPFSHLSPEILDTFEAMGFLVTIGDAPHRPWEREQFLYACALRTTPEHLLTRGFRRVVVETITSHADDAAGSFEIKEVC